MKNGAIFLLVCMVFAGLTGCAKEQPAATETVAAAPEPAAGTPGVLADGFSTPESVLYDAVQDVYFVSNINGSPLDADGNGYISKINAETREVEARWIDGSTEGVSLDAPKGMAIKDDTLWVTDITVVRKFSRTTGTPMGEIAIEGTTFLNDPSIAEDGSVYVTDMGMKAGAEGFEPSGTDAVYKISPDGKVEKIASGDDLMHPNGIQVAPEGPWVVTFGGNEIYQLVDGKKTNVAQLPSTSLDGLIILGGGDVLVSSWDAKSVYRGPTAGPFEAVVTDVNAPADIGFDSKRNLILVPMFMDSKVMIFPLK